MLLQINTYPPLTLLLHDLSIKLNNNLLYLKLWWIMNNPILFKNTILYMEENLKSSFDIYHNCDLIWSQSITPRTYKAIHSHLQQELPVYTWVTSAEVGRRKSPQNDTGVQHHFTVDGWRSLPGSFAVFGRSSMSGHTLLVLCCK